MNKHILLLIAIVCFIFVGCKKKDNEISDNETKGSIYGTVTDLATGNPVRNANVQLRPGGETTLTGSDGMYEFLDVANGDYSITVSKAEYTNLIDDYIISVRNGQRKRRDVQIEKLPAVLRIIDSNGEDISILDFGPEQDVTSRTFSIFNDGSSKLTWWVEENCNWITEVKSMLTNNQSGQIESGKQEPIKVTINRELVGNELKTYILNINSDYGSKELTITAGENVGIPVLITDPVSNVSQNAVTFNGTIVNEGMPSYTERGFVYSSNAQPTIDNNLGKITSPVNNQAEFSANVSGLISNATYFVRAYAINIVDVAYGNDIVFSTAGTQTTLSTSAVTNISATSATLNGTIINEGSPKYTEKGFCYSKNGEPTISNNKVIVSGSGIGTYTIDITNLEYQTTYYVKAYAIQNGQPLYGNTVNFSTSWTNTQVQTSAVSNVGTTSATFNGNIINEGSPAYTERGFCYSTSSNPTISSNKIAIPGSGTGIYTYNISGLDYQTTYYVKTYAIQNGVAIYGNEVDFTTVWTDSQVETSAVSDITTTTAKLNGVIINNGSPAYSERGFCYSNSTSQPTINNIKVIVSNSNTPGNYNKNISGLDEGTTYYVRAYVIQNGIEIYGSSVSFTTNELPVVYTNEVTNLMPASMISWNVTFNGYIESIGNPAYVERGFCYDTHSNPTGNKQVVSGSGTGSFSKNITGLQNYQTYYVRAYAKTSSGTYVYGQNVSFSTYDK